MYLPPILQEYLDPCDEEEEDEEDDEFDSFSSECVLSLWPGLPSLVPSPTL